MPPPTRSTLFPYTTLFRSRTGNVGALQFLYLKHEPADVRRHGRHTNAVEGALQHVRLYARILKRLRPGPYRIVRILPKQQINLLKTSAIGLYPGKTTHVHNVRSHLLQLIKTGYVLARRLPHVSVQQREFYFSSHNGKT